jgi:hypothetical protein
MVLRVQQLTNDLKSLTCELAGIKRNGKKGYGSGCCQYTTDVTIAALQPLYPLLHLLGSVKTCCPLNWMEHEGNCYWFSRSGKSWPQADKYCQLVNAHLVVVNSMEEQVRPG